MKKPWKKADSACTRSPYVILYNRFTCAHVFNKEIRANIYFWIKTVQTNTENNQSVMSQKTNHPTWLRRTFSASNNYE